MSPELGCSPTADRIWFWLLRQTSEPREPLTFPHFPSSLPWLPWYVMETFLSNDPPSSPESLSSSYSVPFLPKELFSTYRHQGQLLLRLKGCLDFSNPQTSLPPDPWNSLTLRTFSFNHSLRSLRQHYPPGVPVTLCSGSTLYTERSNFKCLITVSWIV